MKRKLLLNVSLFFLLLKLASCVNTRPLQYMQGHFDTARLSKYVEKEQVVQIGDLISISVYSDNAKASELYNQANITGSSTPGASALTSGYLVDTHGNIQFPQIGTLHIEGLTKKQLTDLLDQKLSAVLQNPYYNIRFLNYKITMIGEVTREGVYNIPNESVNIFEAIGLSGGLTMYGRRENVMIVRESNGRREFGRLDLTSPYVMQSPYYFLQQNDIVVVEQSRTKPTGTDQVTARNITLLSTVVSTIVIVLTVFRR